MIHTRSPFLVGILILIGLNSEVSASPPALTASQLEFMKQNKCQPIDIRRQSYLVSVYNAKGNFEDAHLVGCSLAIPLLDVSIGKMAPAPGEVTVLVSGRIGLKANRVHNQQISVQRGIPGHSYEVKEKDTFINNQTRTTKFDWAEIKEVPPFMPHQVRQLSAIEGLPPEYGYTDLRALPGLSMSPLRNDSVIVSLDGFGFNSKYALAEPLILRSKANPGLINEPGMRFVEVIYYNRLDTQPKFMRTYLPLYSRGNQDAWRAMLLQNRIFDPAIDWNDLANKAITAAVIVGFGAAFHALSESGLGKSISRQIEADRREAQKAIRQMETRP